MTVNTWRNDILNICKYCKHFVDNGKSKNRYQCWRFGCSVYDAHRCKVTHALRKQASKISKKTLDDAYLALTGGY
jgi:hypothetical protein